MSAVILSIMALQMAWVGILPCMRGSNSFSICSTIEWLTAIVELLGEPFLGMYANLKSHTRQCCQLPWALLRQVSAALCWLKHGHRFCARGSLGSWVIILLGSDGWAFDLGLSWFVLFSITVTTWASAAPASLRVHGEEGRGGDVVVKIRQCGGTHLSNFCGSRS